MVWKKGKGYYLVNWKMSSSQSYQVDLELAIWKSTMNAFLMKWLWRYVKEEQAFWREVIQCKYGQDNQWCTNEVTTLYGVLAWRTIRSLWNKLAEHMKLNRKWSKNSSLEKCMEWTRGLNAVFPWYILFLQQP